MTSSYLVLTAPGGVEAAHEKTQIIRDGFTVLGFLFPWLWLAAHRLWWHAIAAFFMQSLGGALMDRPGLWPVGVTITFGTALLAGFEGQNLRIRDLLARGWTEDALIATDSLSTAEVIYFSNVHSDVRDNVPAPHWETASHSQARHGNATSLGLFGFDGER
jgi:hypothetical protein